MPPIIPDFVKGEVRLPASKSISNRVLILDALSGHQVDLQNLSDSDDTRVLRQFLQSPVRRVDVGLAGTAMRFLAAFLAARQGTFQDAHAMAGRITESGRSHEGKGWYLEKVCGMKKAGVGTDHCMGAEYKIAGF